MAIGILGAGKFAEVLVTDREIVVLDLEDRDFPVESGKIGKTEVFWIRRFGWHDRRPSHLVDHRLPVLALRQLEVRRAITINGFGIINPKMRVGDLAIPHDVFRLAMSAHQPTLFPPGSGWPRVDMGQAVGGPYCPELRQALIQAAKNTSQRQVWEEGVNACVSGPHLEGVADATALLTLGVDIVSTTTHPEDVFMREAGICFASICCLTDIAGEHSTKDWRMIGPEELAPIISHALQLIPSEPRCSCQTHIREELARRPYAFSANSVGGQP